MLYLFIYQHMLKEMLIATISYLISSGKLYFLNIKFSSKYLHIFKEYRFLEYFSLDTYLKFHIT